MTELETAVTTENIDLPSAHAEDIGGRSNSGERATVALQESLLLVYMIGLLLWGFLELTMMVYLTLLSPMLPQTAHPNMLLAANLLALGIGVAFILHYRRFRLAQDALRGELSEQREEFSRQVRQASLTDRLTGLYTLIYFWHRVEGEIERGWRYHHPCSILVIDLRDFSSVNERHGRLTGDLVLRGFSQGVLAGSLRATDLAARYGGDQFAILLPETGAEGAMRLGERIRERAKEVVTLPSGGHLAMAMSAVSFPEDGFTREGLLRTAEARLKEAKRGSLTSKPVRQRKNSSRNGSKTAQQDR